MSCKYCDGSKNQAYLIDEKADMYIDKGAKVVSEHVEVYSRGRTIGGYADIWDCDEVCYIAPIKFCPNCGDKL